MATRWKSDCLRVTVEFAIEPPDKTLFHVPMTHLISAARAPVLPIVAAYFGPHAPAAPGGATHFRKPTRHFRAS